MKVVLISFCILQALIAATAIVLPLANYPTWARVLLGALVCIALLLGLLLVFAPRKRP